VEAEEHEPAHESGGYRLSGTVAIVIVAALALGALLGWLLRASRGARAEAALEAERRSREELRDTFEALSAEALRNSQTSFLELAKASLGELQSGAKSDLAARQTAIDNLVKPVQESLKQVDAKIQALEKERAGAYAGLTEQVRSLATTQRELHAETANLVKALRSPAVRGRWGEIQLKRVVEMAGMLDHCDFFEQRTVTTEEGRLRPDLLVRLPGGKNVIVDAKAPLSAYLEAVESRDDAVRAARLDEHARQVRGHMVRLGSKGYWEQLQPAPEFVVMFLPGETFFGAALEHDPGLLEHGVDRHVIPASPTTLIALLRAVAYGWRQERIAQNAEAISALGKSLYDRLGVLAEHFAEVGKSLERSVASYNKTVGSFEARVLVSARKFRDLGAATTGELPPLEMIETTPRPLPIFDEPGDEPETRG
jgi:DNA recombination protein RmuC